MHWACNAKFYFGPVPWGPGEWSKGQISLNFNNTINFKGFFYQSILCSCKLKICNILNGTFVLMPQGVKILFLGHIKLTEIMSITECN